MIWPPLTPGGEQLGGDQGPKQRSEGVSAERKPKPQVGEDGSEDEQDGHVDQAGRQGRLVGAEDGRQKTGGEDQGFTLEGEDVLGPSFWPGP